MGHALKRRDAHFCSPFTPTNLLWRSFLVAMLWLAHLSHAADHPAVTRLLAADRPPPGVVFEIVTGDPQALSWALPQVVDHAKRLRARFPGLAIAVVTHGREMFALTKDAQARAQDVHRAVEKLVRDEDIPVHVCETYAGWRGLAPEAFPDYVDVAPAGPTQVANYLALGYVLVKIGAPPAAGGASDRLK